MKYFHDYAPPAILHAAEAYRLGGERAAAFVGVEVCM
jgi:hypothetical protein